MLTYDKYISFDSVSNMMYVIVNIEIVVNYHFILQLVHQQYDWMLSTLSDKFVVRQKINVDKSALIMWQKCSLQQYIVR